jgi:hypothetical protein
MVTGLKRLVPVLLQQRAQDVSEADTVTLVKDLLAEVFGFDKYADLTGEYAIRGTYCDLAVKLDDKLVQLVEVKAIGTTLDERHLKQAVDYATNQGCEWVVLTNAIEWKLYNIVFSKPIDKRLIVEADLTTVDPRCETELETLFPFSKDGIRKGAHVSLRERQNATNRYILAALITSDESVLSSIRRELRRIVDVLVDEQEIAAVLKREVIKRDTLEGLAAEEALKRVAKKDKAPRTPRIVEGSEVTGGETHEEIPKDEGSKGPA